MKRFLYEGDVKNAGKIGKFLGEFFEGKLKVCGLLVWFVGVLGRLAGGVCIVVDGVSCRAVGPTLYLKRHTSIQQQPKLKSEEPASEDMAKPVKVIKGKTFKKEVMDSKKDVLLEFYAPWWCVFGGWLMCLCMYGLD